MIKLCAVQEGASVLDFFFALEALVEAEECILHEILPDVLVPALPVAVAKDRVIVEIVDVGEVCDECCL